MAKGKIMDNLLINPVDAGKMSEVELCLMMLHQAFEGVYFIDRKFVVTFWNESAERISGIPADEMIGHIFTDSILKPVDQEGNPITEERSSVKMSMLDGKIREKEGYIRHRNGHLVPVLLRTVPVKKFTKILGVMEAFVDISARQEIQSVAERYKELAFTDNLTGLFNRRYIEDFIQSRLDDFRRLAVPFCVLFLDIDHFKAFNDQYGHEMGDEVIKMVGNSCSMMIRSSDIFGRFGGEEFVSVLTGSNEQNMFVIAETMRTIVENTGLRSNDDALKVTISIGATIARTEDTVESLIKRADDLLYTSKESGRNKVTTG